MLILQKQTIMFLFPVYYRSIYVNKKKIQYHTTLKIITYRCFTLPKQLFQHVLSVIGVENWRMGWKLEPSRMQSWREENKLK